LLRRRSAFCIYCVIYEPFSSGRVECYIVTVLTSFWDPSCECYSDVLRCLGVFICALS